MVRLRRLPEWPTPSHEEIVRRARILVIDDGEFPYLKLFERDQYTITQWADVHALSALETGEFDIILLDLLGVGHAESANEGFGLLQHIRHTSPAQIVVAYSNADLSLQFQPFFREADEVLAKTADYVVFKRTVDDLLDQRFSLGFYLDRIESALGDHLADTSKAREKARVAILTGKTEPLRKFLLEKLEDGRTVDRIIALVGVAASLAGLWKS